MVIRQHHNVRLCFIVKEVILSNGESIEAQLIEQAMLSGQDSRSLTKIIILNPSERVDPRRRKIKDKNVLSNGETSIEEAQLA